MRKEGTSDLDRRSILAGLGAAAFAASAQQASAQTAKGQPLIGNPVLPIPMGERMRWAIVGLGSFGVGQVIPGFVDANASRMTAFVSGNPDKAKMLGERYGVSRFYGYDNFDDIARDPEIDCVYIVLPVGLHAEYTIRALKAGKHVLCEKPMASTVSECEAMIAAAKAAGRQLGVAYRVHFEPTNIAAKTIIDAGEIGPIRNIRADHGFQANPSWPPHKWRLTKELGGGGSMYDIGIYGLNTSLMMLKGDEPVSVSAVYAYPRQDPRFTEVEGGIEWRLMMASGAVVSGSSSYCYAPYQSFQHYMADKGALEMEPATTYYDNHLVRQSGGPPSPVGTGNPITQFAGQIDAFSSAARANKPHRTPGEMGLRDIRLIAAMYRSADRNGEVLAL